MLTTITMKMMTTEKRQQQHDNYYDMFNYKL